VWGDGLEYSFRPQPEEVHVTRDAEFDPAASLDGASSCGGESVASVDLQVDEDASTVAELVLEVAEEVEEEVAEEEVEEEVAEEEVEEEVAEEEVAEEAVQSPNVRRFEDVRYPPELELVDRVSHAVLRGDSLEALDALLGQTQRELGLSRRAVRAACQRMGLSLADLSLWGPHLRWALWNMPGRCMSAKVLRQPGLRFVRRAFCVTLPGWR